MGKKLLMVLGIVLLVIVVAAGGVVVCLTAPGDKPGAVGYIGARHRGDPETAVIEYLHHAIALVWGKWSPHRQRARTPRAGGGPGPLPIALQPQLGLEALPELDRLELHHIALALPGHEGHVPLFQQDIIAGIGQKSGNIGCNKVFSVSNPNN